MNKEELRREFENTDFYKNYEKSAIYENNTNEYWSERYTDYSVAFLNGAWWMFQELKK